MNKNMFATASLPLIMAVVCVFGMIIGMQFQQSLIEDGYIDKIDSPAQTAIYEASEHIKTKYYGTLDESSYTDAVLKKMIEQLDPYSHYFAKSRNQKYNRYMEGLYRGIGLEFVQIGDSAFVYKVLSDSPASDAGIFKGDIVLSLDSIELSGSGVRLDSLMNSKEMKKGTFVQLKTYNRSSRQISEHKLRIEDVSLPLIEDYLIADENRDSLVSYIRIDRFYSDIFRDFMEALDRQSRTTGPVKKVIIDLRDNPGGVVEETIKLLNQFITDKEQLLLSTRSRIEKTKEYFSNGRSFLNISHIVIICNRNTASASEILAGALQDYDKAVIVGENTYGKGLIQQNYDLSNEGSINLSIGEYILPSGRHIHDQGAIDTTYASLVTHRSLYSERGIPVDLAIDECPWKWSYAQRLKELVISRPSLHKMTPEEGSELVEILMAEILPEEKCQEYLSSRALWEVIKDDLDYGDVIPAGDFDKTVQRAIDLIHSSEYYKLLGYK